MKILVIGNANSYWIKEYVENILLKIPNLEVIILSSKFYKDDYSKFYALHNVKILDTSKGKFKHIPKFRTIYNLIYLAKMEAKKGKYDYVHVHYIPQNFLSFIYYLISKLYSYRLICTYWGSDLLSGTLSQIKKSHILLDSADIITYATDDMDEKFHEVFGGKYDNKIRKIPFGVSIYDYIYKNDMSKDDCKRWFDVSTEKYLVAIGYNGSKRQQHIEVINSLASMDNGIKNKICILVHMGYGLNSRSYLDEIKENLESSGIEYKILLDFLDNEKSAILRKATDIFINAQLTDAFSASIQECIYAGVTLINPTWIRYKELDLLGIKYYEYNQINEISGIVKNLVEKNVFICNCEERSNLYDRYSWKGVFKNWSSIYTKE